MATVKRRIIDAIFAALDGLDGVSLVLDAGGRMDAVGEALEAGHVLQVAVMDDEPREQMSGVDIEAASFDVLVLCHLTEESIAEPSKPYQVAADLWGEIYKLWGVDETAGTWGGLALRTMNLGGGGVGISALGTVATAAAFRVDYRFDRADPEVPR